MKEVKASGFLKPHIIFICAGLIIAIVGVIFLVDFKQFFETAGETSAIITDIEVDRHRRNGKTHYDHTVYVEYVVDGVTYNRKLNEYNSTMREGGIVTIRYDKDNPKDIRSDSYFLPICMILVGSLFMFAGFGIRHIEKSAITHSHND